MLPWAHLALGYLFYTVGVHLVRRRRPRGAPTVALAVGTQLPDLVDKPANWWFSILDGRGLGHSLFTTIPLCVAVLVATHRRNRGELGVAFTVGMLTHLLGDARLALLARNIEAGAPYLLWPLLPAPTYEKDSLLDHLLAWRSAVDGVQLTSLSDLVTTDFGVQLLVFTVILFVWMLDGFPGLRLVWDRTLGTVRATAGGAR